jgi:hypothetical protein
MSYATDDLLILKDKHQNNLLMRTVIVNNYELFKFIINYMGCAKIDWKQTNLDGDNIFDLSKKNGNIGIQRKMDKIHKESSNLS